MAAQGSAAHRRANEAALGELLRRELSTALDSMRERGEQQGVELRNSLLQQGAETREMLLRRAAEHHADVTARLDGIYTTLNALTNGSIQLGIQGMAFFGGNPPARHVPVATPLHSTSQSLLQPTDPTLQIQPPGQPVARTSAPTRDPEPAPTPVSSNLFDPNPPINANLAANTNTRIDYSPHHDANVNGNIINNSNDNNNNNTPQHLHLHLNPLEPGPPTRSRNPRSSTNPPPGTPGGPPDYVLARLRTVPDAWTEWKSGINGGPAVEELERVWGGAWRPTGKARVAFCRRKIIWDEVAKLMRTGLSAEEACHGLERLRNGGSLVDLGKAVKARRRGRGGAVVDGP